MSRPYAVTVDEISSAGSMPLVAPVKPYTEFADSFSASWRPSSTALRNGSFSTLRSSLARLRAASRSRRMRGSTPSRAVATTNTSPVGERAHVSGGSAASAPGGTSVE
jgi:hypothetical protein